MLWEPRTILYVGYIPAELSNPVRYSSAMILKLQPCQSYFQESYTETAGFWPPTPRLRRSGACVRVGGRESGVIFCIPSISPGGAEAELLRSHLVNHSSRIPASPFWGKQLPLTQVQFLGWEDQLEKGMAIHSSILAWRIPRAEEPGRLQSMGLQSWTQLSDSHTYTHTFSPEYKTKQQQ